MNTLHVFLRCTFSETTTQACVDGVNFLLQENDYQNVDIYLNSKGGVVAQAEKLAAFFQRSELSITTWNVGFTESASQILYSLGEFRYAEMEATFLFHKAAISESSRTLPIANDIWDYWEQFEQQETRRIAQLISGNVTDTSLDQRSFLRWMFQGRRLSAQEAYTYGYAHEIRAPEPLNSSSDFVWVRDDLVLVMSKGKGYHKWVDRNNNPFFYYYGQPTAAPAKANSN